MRLAVLYSGGKDSTLALYKAIKHEEVVCLISIISTNPESYMFHTPNINLTKMQSEAMEIPIIQKKTEGHKEKELDDLKIAIKEAIDKFSIEGIVTGAVESVYQASRIQKICNELDLWCFNPLWQKDQIELLKELQEFEVMITGVFAYPMESNWLGKKINNEVIESLKKIRDKYKISPTGEGGEIETTVTDAPFFKKKIEIIDSKSNFSNNAGILKITKAKLTEK